MVCPLFSYVPTNVAAGATVTAVIGGTVSRLTGGKFANGAVTAAFGYLFNSALSGTIQGEGGSLVDDLRAFGRGIVRTLGRGISGLASVLRGDTPEDVYLFRVVDDVELGSIMATKSFSIRPAGFQQKQFFPGIEDARFFATEGLARLGVTVDVSIVQTSVSVETYRLGYEFLDAGRLAVSFGPEQLPALNADAQRNGIFVRESYP